MIPKPAPTLPSREQALGVFWKVAPALVVGVFCFAIGSECSSSALEAQHAAEIQAAIESQASSHENIVRVKDTKYRTLHEQFEAQSGELDGARDQNGQLLSEKSVQAALISELRGDPATHGCGRRTCCPGHRGGS